MRLLDASGLNALDDALLARLIPFLDQDSVYTIFDRIMSGKSGAGLIKCIRPFIGYDLIETAVMYGVLDYPEQ